MEEAKPKKHIITIAGRPGSGKSTASKAVAKQLGYEHFSSGDLFRAIGRERGIDVYQTNLAAEDDKEIDQLVDERLRDIGKKQNDVSIDSRLAWHWIPQSFKVYLDLDLRVAARRIMKNSDPIRLKNENVPADPDVYALVLQKRLDSEARRYLATYNANPYDKSNYNLVVDTDANGPEEVVELILNHYRAWLAEQK